MTWRVGQHYGIHVYDGDRPVATFHREEDARRAVDAVNTASTDDPPPTNCLLSATGPGGTPHRPHLGEDPTSGPFWCDGRAIDLRA